MSINKHIRFQWNFFIWADNAPSKNKEKVSNKNLNNWHENPYFELLARVVKRPPEYYRLLLLPLNVVFHRRISRHYYWRHHSLQRQGLKAPLTKTNLNVSYQKVPSVFQRRETIIGSPQLWYLWTITMTQ